MNTYDDVFGVSTKKSEQVGGGQRGSAFRFWRRRKNWRMLQGKANPIALACRDLTSFFFLVVVFLLSGWSGISSVCVVGCSIRCPKSQIVTQKLHDQRRVLVAILVKGVQLSNSLIKGLKVK